MRPWLPYSGGPQVERDRRLYDSTDESGCPVDLEPTLDVTGLGFLVIDEVHVDFMWTLHLDLVEFKDYADKHPERGGVLNASSREMPPETTKSRAPLTCAKSHKIAVVTCTGGKAR